MEETKELQVKISKEFNLNIDEIFQYGVETFGINQAEKYENAIWQLIENLPRSYKLFPVCRHLPTKSKMYRWIILDSHLIIYRIAKEDLEVLRILHVHRSITNLKTSRKVRL